MIHFGSENKSRKYKCECKYPIPFFQLFPEDWYVNKPGELITGSLIEDIEQFWEGLKISHPDLK